MPAVTPLPNGARISETLTRGDGPVQRARSIAERSLWIEREGAVLLPSFFLRFFGTTLLKTA
jgi:hypothetical protein